MYHHDNAKSLEGIRGLQKFSFLVQASFDLINWAIIADMWTKHKHSTDGNNSANVDDIST